MQNLGEASKQNTIYRQGIVIFVRSFYNLENILENNQILSKWFFVFTKKKEKKFYRSEC